MEKFPVEIEKCPLVEAILEIRFSSVFPEDAVFGIIYNSVLDTIKNFKVIQQPIMQIPAEIRQRDINMKYQPYYQLLKDNLSVGIGPHTLVFSNRIPYLGWNKFNDFVLSILDKVAKTNIANKIERIGLRYINVIDVPLQDATHISISLGDVQQEKSDVATLHLEKVLADNYSVAFQLNDNVQVSIENSQIKKASMIDIDMGYNNLYGTDIKLDSLNEILEKLHDFEKQYFFNLLKPKFLDGLNPAY